MHGVKCFDIEEGDCAAHSAVKVFFTAEGLHILLGWIVVTDDRPARRVCAQRNVIVTGTIGIIKASLLDGRITLKQANDILQKMTHCGFYSPVRRMDDLK